MSVRKSASRPAPEQSGVVEAKANASTASEGKAGPRAVALARWAWLLVPVLAAAMLVLWVADVLVAWPVRSLSLFIYWGTAVLGLAFVVIPAARSFLAAGKPSVLMLGCGMLTIDVALFVMPAAFSRSPDVAFAIYNTSVLLGALCHFAGVIVTSWRQILLRHSSRWLAATYAGAVTAMGLVIWGAFSGRMPAFFVDDQGGTLLRAGVVSASVVLFILTAGLLWRANRRAASPFLYWYSLGLALLAVGLIGSVPIIVVDSPLQWVSRFTQVLGAVFMCVAVLYAPRATRSRETLLDALAESSRKNELLSGLRRQTPLGFSLRYGLAVAAVAAGWGMRLALTVWVGASVPPFTTLFPAIMVVALLAGLGPGLVATAFADAAVATFILRPGGVPIASRADRLGLAVFTCMGLFISLVAEFYRRSRDKAAAYDREASLRDSRARLAAFAEATFEGIIESEAGRVVDCNEQFARMTGYTVADLRGMEVAELVVDEDRARLIAVACQGGNPVIEYTLLRKDGARIVVEARSRTVSLDDGTRYTVVRDITERKRAEEALRQSEERHRLLAETMLQGVVHHDLEGAIISMNSAAERILGVTRQELLGGNSEREGHDTIREDGSHFPGSEYPAMVALRTGRPMRDVVMGVFNPRERAYRWIGIDSVPLFRPGEKKPYEVYSVFADITERKSADDALREADRRKNEFLGILSHELRNPLSPIRNSLYILERVAPGSEQARRAHSVIDRQVGHLARLVDDLLDITRISRGKIRLQRARLDLVDLVRRTVEDHRSVLEGHGIGVELPREAIWINGDPTRLAQAIGNLLNNAAKFTPEGGKIAVALARVQGSAVLEVSDTGLGIDSETLKRLFEPFAQADRSLDRSRGGLGLGLALVKGMVELHQGEVKAHSDGPGRGSRFTVKLPLGEQGATARDPLQRPEAAIGGRKVLVIEDNKDSADSLSEALALSGHRVAVAREGAAGLAKAREFRPEVVVCDIGLPAGMDGYAVARALRRDPLTVSSYLIALTGYAQPEDQRRALDAGFDAHLAKPLDLTVFDRLLAGAPAQVGSAPA